MLAEVWGGRAETFRMGVCVSKLLSLDHNCLYGLFVIRARHATQKPQSSSFIGVVIVYRKMLARTSAASARALAFALTFALTLSFFASARSAVFNSLDGSNWVRIGLQPHHRVRGTDGLPHRVVFVHRLLALLVFAMLLRVEAGGVPQSSAFHLS